MESTVAIISSIVALISTVGTLIYKGLMKKSDDREQEYYSKLLKPFIGTIRHNPDVDAIKFVKANVKLEDDFVPKYITYLVNQGAEKREELQKVLIVDYISLYENVEKGIQRVYNALSKIMAYVVLFWSVALIFMGSFVFTLGLLTIVEFIIDGFSMLVSQGAMATIEIWKEHREVILQKLSDNMITFGIHALLGGIILGISILLEHWVAWATNDRYTLRKKRIERKIDKKVTYFGRHKDKFIF